MSSIYQKNLERIEKIANAKDLVLNPDTARIEKVVGLIGKNKETYGEYFCPCKQVNDIPKLGEDVTCPCPALDEEIEKDGQCGCRVFFK
jgi:ferredoxin-thioredoxin reductase catalytic subunit